MVDIAPEEAEYDKPVLRHVFLWGGFLLILLVGVWTVLLPALEDDPGEEPGAESSAESAESADDE